MTLEVQELSVRFAKRKVVTGVSLNLPGSLVVGLVGPNGAGKSSLLKAIVGLLPSDGTLLWQRSNLRELSAVARARTIAFLPQTPRAHWPLTVNSLVALGRLPHRRLGSPLSEADNDAIRFALEATDVTNLAERRVDELSGGEFARVQLARTLCVDAPIVMVDEPTAQLDPYHQLQIMSMLRAYAGSGHLVITVMHDLALAARYCDRIVMLQGGAIVGDGPPRSVLGFELLRRIYGIDTYIAEYGQEPVVVPWRCAAD